jgi:hypothetical protein
VKTLCNFKGEENMSSARTPISRPTLASAQNLAEGNPIRHANESAQYLDARNALLAEEIELTTMAGTVIDTSTASGAATPSGR